MFIDGAFHVRYFIPCKLVGLIHKLKTLAHWFIVVKADTISSSSKLKFCSLQKGNQAIAWLQGGKVLNKAGTIRQILRIVDSWFFPSFPKRITIQWIDSFLCNILMKSSNFLLIKSVKLHLPKARSEIYLKMILSAMPLILILHE